MRPSKIIFFWQAVLRSLYFIYTTGHPSTWIYSLQNMNFEIVYQDAQKKEGMFDDSPTVAYQLENNFSFIKQNPYAFPEMRTDFDLDEFYSFYETLINKIYHRKSF